MKFLKYFDNEKIDLIITKIRTHDILDQLKKKICLYDLKNCRVCHGF